MISSIYRGALGATALVCVAAGASAHVTLERTSAVPNTSYRGVLQVNHGCGGAATTSISVTIPDGVIGVRPMPKPGWSLTIERAAYKTPYRLHGETLTEGPREVTWSGGTVPDDQYDEFVFVARVAEDRAPDTMLYFPVVQVCGATSSRWTEEPAPGGPASARLRYPAPAVRVVAQAANAAVAALPEHDMSMHMGGGDAPAETSGRTYRAGEITVESPWMRATPGGAQVAGGYLRVTNGGSAPDRLVAASIPLAKRGEVHEMSSEGGIIRMHEVEGGLEVKPGQTIELKPGGYHLMFMDLSAAPKQGEEIRGTLTFAKAGTVSVLFPVGSIGAQAPAAK